MKKKIAVLALLSGISGLALVGAQKKAEAGAAEVDACMDREAEKFSRGEQTWEQMDTGMRICLALYNG